jgi:hypothetical protein
VKIYFHKEKNGEPILGDIFPVGMGSEQSPNAWFGHPDPESDWARLAGADRLGQGAGDTHPAPDSAWH